MSLADSVRRGQPAAPQGWLIRERMADSGHAIKHAAYATAALAATVGSGYLLYSYPMPLKLAGALVIGGFVVSPLICSWNVGGAQYHFQNMWHGRTEMNRRHALERARFTAQLGQGAQRAAGAVVGFIGNWFNRPAQA